MSMKEIVLCSAGRIPAVTFDCFALHPDRPRCLGTPLARGPAMMYDASPYTSDGDKG